MISLRVFLPEATSSTSFHSFSDSFSRESPSTIVPALKSIQWRLRSYKAVLDESLMHGMAVPSGFPLPVVNSRICAPEATRSVMLTLSFPGPVIRFNPGLRTGSP